MGLRSNLFFFWYTRDMNIDDFLEDLKNGTICTSIPSCDLYTKIQNSYYYNSDDYIYYGIDDEIFYESYVRFEEKYIKLEKVEEELQEVRRLLEDNDDDTYPPEVIEEHEEYVEKRKGNKYIKALKYRYDNRKKDSSIKYIYMFKVYEILNSLDLDEYEDCSYIINELIENLDCEGKEGTIYNISQEVVGDLLYDLNDLKEGIEYLENNMMDIYSLNNTKEQIIEKYFISKEKEYKENRSKKFNKRQDRENEYLNLLNSYEYRTKKMSKRDIAKILNVTPAAVTQFCKRHGIT